MPYTIPARISREGHPIPEIIVDAEFKEVVDGMIVSLRDRKKCYASVMVNGKHVQLHRLLWTLKHGSCPDKLDHINENKLDCRLGNLRPASPSLNGRNQNKRLKGSRQDLPKGVTYVPLYKSGTPTPKPYQAQMTVRRRVKNLGYYATPEEAGSVYKAMKFMLILVESALCG